jgi:SET domain-containing protein
MAKTSIAISTIPLAGFGLFAREAIPIGTFIGVYSGELCRAEDQDLIKGKPSYIWGFEKDRIINAKYKGNKSRFMNHNRDNSNVTVRVVTALGTSYVLFTTARAIAAGEELTINYGKDSRRII